MAFRDKSLQLTNAHTGKVIHQVDYATHSSSQICCLGWSINSTANTNSSGFTKAYGPDVSLDDLLQRNQKVDLLDEPPDLPSDLASLDVEALLPKLSTLAPGASEYVTTSKSNSGPCLKCGRQG